jgi:hypothetical protein
MGVALSDSIPVLGPGHRERAPGVESSERASGSERAFVASASGVRAARRQLLHRDHTASSGGGVVAAALASRG